MKPQSHNAKVDWGSGVVNGNMSGDLTSVWIPCAGYEEASITLHAASATHVGTIAIDTTDDPTGTVYNTETLSSTPTAASGSAFDARVALDLGGAGWFRVRYVYGSGTGTLTGYYTVR